MQATVLSFDVRWNAKRGPIRLEHVSHVVSGPAHGA
jgi:hypothetical protein